MESLGRVKKLQTKVELLIEVKLKSRSLRLPFYAKGSMVLKRKNAINRYF